MVPADYLVYFSVMAGVGATLFGLIFLAVSIKPQSTGEVRAPIMEQVQIASSYTALLNPLIISLFALIPKNTIGLVTLIMSIIALVNTLLMSLTLLQGPFSWLEGLRRGLFILGSFLIFGFEIIFAIELNSARRDLDALDNLVSLLIIIYVYGVARAWDLLGARQFHFQDIVTSLAHKKHERSPTDPALQQGNGPAVSER